jgi:hypothetical protein
MKRLPKMPTALEMAGRRPRNGRLDQMKEDNEMILGDNLMKVVA